jgi:hypothetical protein
MNLSVCDPEVWALLVGAGEALSVYAFWGPAPAFDLAPRPHRQRRWFYTCRERGRKATGWTIAWGAWFEQTMDQGVCRLRSQVREIKMRPVKVPKPYEAKDEEEREQEQEGMKSHKLKGHNNPRCLKWGAWRDPVSGRIRRIQRDCQAIGREVRIIHHRETLYQRVESSPSKTSLACLATL